MINWSRSRSYCGNRKVTGIRRGARSSFCLLRSVYYFCWGAAFCPVTGQFLLGGGMSGDRLEEFCSDLSTNYDILS